MPFKQKIIPRIERKCPYCFKTFYCTGRCGDEIKIKKSKTSCLCKECVTFEALMLRKKRCPNYRNLSLEEIIKACYGSE